MAAFLCRVSLAIFVALLAVANGASWPRDFVVRDDVHHRQKHVSASGASMRHAMQAQMKKRQHRMYTGVRGLVRGSKGGAHPSQGLSKAWRKHSRKSSDELPFSKKWMGHHRNAPRHSHEAAILAKHSTVRVATKKNRKQTLSLTFRAFDARYRQKVTAPSLLSLVQKAHAAVNHSVVHESEADKIKDAASEEEVQEANRWLQKKKDLQQRLRQRRVSLLAKNQKSQQHEDKTN